MKKPFTSEHLSMAASFTTVFFFSTFFSVLTLSSALDDAGILLKFKASLEDPMGSLSNWSNTTSIHFCNWTGIACTTGPSPSVTTINLQGLNLSGQISPSICKLPNLSHLNLANNPFNQPIPLHLSQCTSLQTLNFSNSLIWGTIPDQVSLFSSLRVLDFSRNHVGGRIPNSLGSLKGLQVLNLGSNLFSGTVPSAAFGNLSELTVLDLSGNALLLSEIPGEIGKLEKLEQLFLQSSGFHGSIPDSLLGLRGLEVLDLSQNNLSGEIPLKLGFAFGNLISIDLSQNKLSGSFPSGLCLAKGLINLNLHTNFFTGLINDSLHECLNLERFQVQNNGFSGALPNVLWSLPKIKLIRAENNRFSGEIPDSISMATQLEQVQIDNNSFSGRVPQGFGMVRSLYRFSASLNGFYGEIPPNFCNSPVMSIINLSHNLLSGRIPELDKCRKLVSFSVSDNSLTGEIPASLAGLPVLTYIDLSDNNLTGPIPQELQNLKLALFNVSFNQLSGRVPSSLISGLPASFLQGNPDLCGPGLPNPCADDKPQTLSARSTKLIHPLISIAIAAGITMVAAALFLMYRSLKKKESRSCLWRSVFFYPLRITEQDLITGMDEKSSVGNGGTFGKTYLIKLPRGETVAVKKLMNFGTQSFKVLKAEMKTLAKIRHKNITKLLGFCCSEDSILLIYECIPRGSLGNLIGRLDFQLEWNDRLRIAITAAQGLAYLHKDYIPHLLHRNIKSRNILLDSDFEPKITDFALDRIVGESIFLSSMDSDLGSCCYMAPEIGYCKKATEQMDVYSFGVVLLELITGRQAEQADSGDSIDVVKWVRRKINMTNGAAQVLDPKIANSSQQEMMGALEVALRCTSVMPEKRPAMSEVIRSLQSLHSKTSLSTAFSSENGIFTAG